MSNAERLQRQRRIMVVNFAEARVFSAHPIPRFLILARDIRGPTWRGFKQTCQNPASE
jgi:hypothetical protein